MGEMCFPYCPGPRTLLIYTCTYMFYIHTHIFIYICAHFYICIYSVYVNVYAHLSLYICTYVHTYICIYIYTCIYGDIEISKPVCMSSQRCIDISRHVETCRCPKSCPTIHATQRVAYLPPPYCTLMMYNRGVEVLN